MRKRPFPVTLLLLIVSLYTLWNGIRIFGSIKFWEIMIEYNAFPGPLYLAIISIAWVLIGTICLFGLIKKFPWSLTMLKISTLLYSSWYWFDRFLFRNNLQSFWLPMLFSLITIAIMIFLLHHKKTKNYFRVSI